MAKGGGAEDVGGPRRSSEEEERLLRWIAQLAACARENGIEELASGNISIRLKPLAEPRLSYEPPVSTETDFERTGREAREAEERMRVLFHSSG